MRIIYILLASIICIVVSDGCSTIYTVKDFSSKNNYYKEINDNIKGKSVNITLINDSTFENNDGVLLSTDTLSCFKTHTDSKVLNKKDITDIKYTSSDYRDAVLVLKTGEELKVTDFENKGDSFNMNVTYYQDRIISIAPTEKIKNIVYNDRNQSILPGVLFGGLSGLAVGVFINNAMERDVSHQNNNGLFYGFIISPLTGMIVGAIISNIIGYKFIYHLNP
jgi:hypothetical protein